MPQKIEKNYRIIFVLQHKFGFSSVPTDASTRFKVDDIVTLDQLSAYAKEMGMVYERDTKGWIYIKDYGFISHVTAEPDF